MRGVRIFSAIIICLLLLCGCSADNNTKKEKSFADIMPIGSMKLEYATQFTVDYYENGLSLINIADGESYLVVPDGENVPNDISDEITVIRQPVSNIYLAASSAMDLFVRLDSLDSIRLTSIDKNSWALTDVTAAMESGNILYVGKYSAPDYEMILSEKCGIAVESTMIYHSPEIKEQLEKHGIPVLVERSSYEAHPLGRMEWIKLYGLLLGKEDGAVSFFEEKSKLLDSIENDDSTMKTAAFFYIGSNGYVNVRKPGDYISKMIELAGGEYILNADNLGVEDNALSTMNMQFEAFYGAAKDADYLIYNSTVDGGLTSVDELLEKNKLLADFKAVQNGNVWCTDKNMFQQTSGATDMVAELNSIFEDNADDKMQYLYRLK